MDARAVSGSDPELRKRLKEKFSVTFRRPKSWRIQARSSTI